MKKIVFLFGASALFWASCTKDYFDGEKLDKAMDQLEWDPEIAVPLVYSSYSIEDLLAGNEDVVGDFVQIGSDKLITLVYEDELLSLKAEDAMIIPDQAFVVAYNQPVTIPSYVGNSITFSGSQNNAFNGGSGNQIDSIYLKSGFLNLTFTSTFQHDVSVNISIPDLQKNGVPFQQMVNLSFTGSVPITNNVVIDMTGYIVDLTDGGTTYNQLVIDYDIDVTGNGNPVTAGDAINVNGSMIGIKFAKLFGYLNVAPISSAPDSVLLNIFEQAQGVGQFQLVNPSVKFTFKNSIGVPLDCNFNQFMGVNTNSGSTFDLSNNPDIPTPLPILSPNFSQIGQELSSSFTIANSGVRDLINGQPNIIIYSVNSGTLSGSGQQGFVLDTSSFKVTMRVEMPLYGRADIFTIRDTIDFSISSDSASSGSGSSASTDTSNIEIDLVSLTLKSILKNQFPMDISLQGYLINENGAILDSLLNGFTTIPSAQVDANGRSTTPGVVNIESIFTKARVEKFADIKKIVIMAKAATLNGATQDVKIYSDYQLSVKIGIKAKITTKK
jgi:hypothetical protein